MKRQRLSFRVRHRERAFGAYYAKLARRQRKLRAERKILGPRFPNMPSELRQRLREWEFNKTRLHMWRQRGIEKRARNLLKNPGMKAVEARRKRLNIMLRFHDY